jgi:hypothetical protein
MKDTLEIMIGRIKAPTFGGCSEFGHLSLQFLGFNPLLSATFQLFDYDIQGIDRARPYLRNSMLYCLILLSIRFRGRARGGSIWDS